MGILNPDPKPIKLTQVDSGSYAGQYEPQPLLIVGDVPSTADPFDLEAALAEITGYDAGATQTLKNVAGTLTWVTD